MGAVVALIAIVAAAVVIARRVSDPRIPSQSVAEPSGRLQGPKLPPTGGLAGTLVFTEADDGCRIRTLRLADLTLGPRGPKTDCKLWVSPTGRFAVAAIAGGQSAFSAPLALVKLDGEPRILRRLGQAAGVATWSPDGARVAWCGKGGLTVVLTLASGLRKHVRGCAPRFAPDGSLLTLPVQGHPRAVLKDGRVSLSRRDLARGVGVVPGRLGVEVNAYDVSRAGLLAVAVWCDDSRPGRHCPLEFWRGTSLEHTLAIPRPEPQIIGFSPDGLELVLSTNPYRLDLRLMLVNVRTLRVTRLQSRQRAFAWSPDGDWLILATDDSIDVYGSSRARPEFALPVNAATVAWR